MKKRLLLLLVLVVGALGASTWYIGAQGLVDLFGASQPDLPPTMSKDAIGMERFLQMRSEHIAMLRGLDTMKQESRSNAIREMETKERELAARGESVQTASWRPLGPAPIPNGQTLSRTDPVSGRIAALAVDPSDPNIVYAGAAQGGFYRSLDGGANWVPLLDNALSLATGAIAISPSDPTTVFVGTGESSFSADGFFGVGIYRITNATTVPVISGPLNAGSLGGDVFTGRAISEIIVHPTDPNIIFASTTSGTCGNGGCTGQPLPAVGVYRSSNALSPSPTFERITIQGLLGNRSVIDLAIEPGNANRLIAAVVGSGSDGGIYVAPDALAATPSFTRTLATADGAELGRAEIAVNKTGAVLTVWVASGTGSGTVFKSVDGGATFPSSIDNNFCSGQCFYDVAIAADPVDATKVYLGGSPTLAFGRSTDGGSTFPASTVGLHVDTQAIAVAPSNPAVVYFGSDGGVWRSVDSGSNWVSQNNTTLSATQFQSIALHPTDRNFTIGGTQDNGTEWQKPNGTWVRATGGDGGQSLIDQNAVDTTTVTAYHTFFNQTNGQIGYQRISTFNAAGTTQAGTFRGCTGAGTQTGISCSDSVLFYAPLSRGPGNPNTTYIGTTKLYRSADRGDNHATVSQVMPFRLSAIGIAPTDDNVRLVGLTNGQVFLTTNGSTTLTDVTGAIAASPRYVSRSTIDPTNANVAYITLTGYGIAGAQHVWKTTNLLSGTPTWTPAGNGLPDVPVNGFAIDPANTQVLYAGSDIGVFRSSDGGANWLPFSQGLPRVAVFGVEFQGPHRVLRIATHGRGMYEFDLNARAAPYDFDADGKTDISVFRPTGGIWFINRSSDGALGGGQFGLSTDEIVPGDFTGDGKADIAVWRPSTGQWFVLRSEDGVFFVQQFGSSGDVTAPADYDADGKADLAVFRPSSGLWFIQQSGGGTVITQFGVNGDHPVAADYDGDGRSDIAIYRPSDGSWWVQRSTAGLMVVQFGNSADKPVQGDYTGDGKADVAFWRPSTGFWYVLRSEDFAFYAFPWGLSADVPAPGDYDGDGKFDASIFRPSAATWFVSRSTAGTLIQQFGAATDQPVPGAFVP